jgi:hypothetical protein
MDSITRASQIGNTSLSQGGERTDLSDTVVDAAETAEAIPGLQDLLDANEAALTANRAAVDAAIEAATQAGAAGIAAGEAASLAADDAIAKAQQALEAASTAGGNSTYTGRPPTSADPGTPGMQWFVWDANYTVTARYVFDGDTSTWVEATLENQVIDNLDAGVITSGYLSSARIAANSLTAAQIAADTLTSREIGADAILARNIKALQITATHIAASTITGDKIAANTITAGNIQAGSITANEIAAGSITANEINLGSLNGKTITGATIKTATSGARLEILNTLINVYNATNGVAASIKGSSYGGTQGSVTLQGIWNGAAGTLDVVGAVPETARTGSVVPLGGGITNPTAGVIGATTTTFAPGYRASQLMISPEFWLAQRSQSPGGQGRRVIGSFINNGYDISFGAFQRVSYSYFNPDTQRQTDVPVIFGAENGSPTAVSVQADKFLGRDGGSIVPGGYQLKASPSGDFSFSGSTHIGPRMAFESSVGIPSSAWSGGILTMPTGSDGTYLVSLSIRVTNPGSATIQAFLTLNGTAASSRLGFQDGANATATFPLQLAAGDQLYPWAFSSGTSVTAATATSFSVYRLGA